MLGKNHRVIDDSLFQTKKISIYRPLIIEGVNRNEYLDALREYREEKSLDKLIELFKKEQEFYLEK